MDYIKDILNKQPKESSGSGDVKQADRRFDELARQLAMAQEAKAQYPAVTDVFGGDAEAIYRSQPENYPIGRGVIAPSRLPDEYAYGNVFKKAKALLPEKDHEYLDMRSKAEELSGQAFDKDFLKSKDFSDFLTKLQQKEGTNAKISFDSTLPSTGAVGEFDSDDNSITLSDKSKGTAMHEIGHARVEKLNPSNFSRAEHDFNADLDSSHQNSDILRYYLPQKALNDPKAMKYVHPWLPAPKDPNESTWFGFSDKGRDHVAKNTWGGDLPSVKAHINDDTIRRELLNQAIDEGRAQLIAKGASGGHHEGYTVYPIDRTLQEYKDQLDKRGFERQMPESNPKFEKLRSLIQTLRKLNK